MVTTTDRQRIRAELVALGYAWEYIDEWQPKATLYRHAPGLDIEGNVAFPVGTPLKGVPGNPDYVLKKARLGMFQYLPGETCECRWCSVRNAHAEPIAEEGKVDIEVESVVCQECGDPVTTLTKAGALSRLRVHMKTHQVSE